VRSFFDPITRAGRGQVGQATKNEELGTKDDADLKTGAWDDA
jgi:hypothetical protein